MSTLARHPFAPGVVAGLVAAMTIIGYLQVGAHPAHIGWTALFFSILASLSWIDATTEMVPDVLTLALVITGIAHATAVGAALWPVAGGAVLVLICGVLHGKITGDQGWIGSGDFFLVAGIWSWFGPFLLLDVLALTLVGLMFHGLIARRASIAVAPSLSAASALIWIGGPLI